MQKNSLSSFIERLYEHFYRKIYSNPNYIYLPSDRGEKYISSFIELLDKKYKIQSIGREFLIKYFLFQFNYWYELDINSFNKRVNIQYIIGKKAFKRWIDRDVSYDWSILQSFVIPTLNIQSIPLPKLYEKVYERLSKSEEVEKKRWINTTRGFLNCIENTTLYKKNSGECLVCKFKVECKKILRRNYPIIYKNRF